MIRREKRRKTKKGRKTRSTARKARKKSGNKQSARISCGSLCVSVRSPFWARFVFLSRICGRTTNTVTVLREQREQRADEVRERRVCPHWLSAEEGQTFFFFGLEKKGAQFTPLFFFSSSFTFAFLVLLANSHIQFDKLAVKREWLPTSRRSNRSRPPLATTLQSSDQTRPDSASCTLTMKVF